VSGVFANELARQHPECAHALLLALPQGGFRVSVRAPLNRPTGADELCRRFPGGGGRKAAAGIDALPSEAVGEFTAAFQSRFAR